MPTRRKAICISIRPMRRRRFCKRSSTMLRAPISARYGWGTAWSTPSASLQDQGQRMTRNLLTAAICLLPMNTFVYAHASAPERTQPLILTEAIPLEGIKGRFDHFGLGDGRLFISALGSNAVE